MAVDEPGVATDTGDIGEGEPNGKTDVAASGGLIQLAEWKTEAETVKDNAAKVEVFDPHPDLPPSPDKSQKEPAADLAVVNREDRYSAALA